MNKVEELIEQLCPNGVTRKTLGELGKFYGGLTGKSKEDFIDGNAKFITYRNVYSNPSLNLYPEETVKISADEKQRTLQYADIVFTGSSETPDECGFASVVTSEPEEDLYLNSFCFFLRLNDISIFNPNFTKHLFRCRDLRIQIGKTASGVTRYNVSKKLMEKVSIPIPPLPVQDEIVRILDTFTDHTAELQAELQARKKQYEYFTHQLLNFEENDAIPLEEVMTFRNGKGHEKAITNNGKYIVVNSKFISTNGDVKKYSDEQISPLFVDDILLVMSDLPNGRALSRTFLVTENDKYTLNQRICALTVKDNKKYNTKFLYYYLNRNPQFLRYDNGADQTNLKKSDILNIDIPVISLQKQLDIVNTLEKLDNLCNSIYDGLPAEIEARQKQYEYYRNKLLTFKELNA